jgi:hypothetical protein
VYKDTGFNIALKNNMESVNAFSSFHTISVGQHEQNAVIVLSTKKYTKMCITFDQGFPNANSPGEYCRDINENVFNTGTRVSIDNGNSAVHISGGTGSNKGFLEK